MDAKDFMQGNWFMTDQDIAEKIYDLQHDRINDSRHKLRNGSYIPINSVFLHKFGFIASSDGNNFELGSVSVALLNGEATVRIYGGDNRTEICSSVLNYIHQIQNLFRVVTSEDLHLSTCSSLFK